jgi:adenine-specific DNA-methyltransferase
MSKTKIEAIKHPADSRTNIPTAELRDFVADDESHPKTMLYPRDPSLDPQLVWKGKDDQDRQDLGVPVVPIYIQEKIHPQALIEDIRATAQGGPNQSDLFSDFNGIDFEQLIEFYQHNHHWSNRMILGDSLQVMASLAEKEGLKGKVQMIYLDPPYGIKFGSNWQVSTRKRKLEDGKAEDFTRQPEQIKAFRDTWEFGIHSYLAYLRDRLVVAKELLTESGSIFVQIGDENVHLVRCLLDEVFGSGNFVSQITFKKTHHQESDHTSNIADYLLLYAKRKESIKFRKSWKPASLFDVDYSKYTKAWDETGNVVGIPKEFRYDPSKIPDDWVPFRDDITLTQDGGDENENKLWNAFGMDFYPGIGRHWRTHLDGLKRLNHAGRVKPGKTRPFYIEGYRDSPSTNTQNIWTENLAGAQNKVYIVQTNIRVIQSCILMTTDPGDLVLDPTCGSGTTAYVAEQWGRRWITTDTSRVALALARTRLMAARFPYYYLADSEDGRKKTMEFTCKIPPQDAPTPTGDIKKGFVYETVPHITLKSIANNPEIDEIHAKWQEKLELLQISINRVFDQKWEEWEISREIPATFKGDKKQAENLLKEWWDTRRQRQQEIDASIARNADTETLYDQPYEDKKRVRVTGPFTVESLSPHRVVPTDDDSAALPRAETEAKREAADFATMILDNLRKAGVQNTVKNERLRFDRLEPYAGGWLHAEGEYTETDGTVKRVAVSIGPEHGTVGALQVKEASKEAVQGVGFDMLLVCGFAFDPSVTEEAKRYGKLVVLPVKMNPDLAMGDDLLKKTGSGNLFMVFGEPDIQPVDPKNGKLISRKDGTLQVEIKGLDIYDPTTGQIRSHSTDDIACWFIDTNYNGESFFVRHAYFTGGDKPYEKLKKALKADIDEAAWEALYSTKSRVFPEPETGKVAVKVINHYGDEVVKVFEVN